MYLCWLAYPLGLGSRKHKVTQLSPTARSLSSSKFISPEKKGLEALLILEE